MEKPQADKLLQLARSKVECGCYAMEYKNYIEMRNDRMTKTQAKKFRLACKRDGVKAYVNGI